ncbi:MAG: hypothetical protein ACJ8AW_20545 [Rhodopila sp.]
MAALRSGGGASRQVLRRSIEGACMPLFSNTLWLEFEDVLSRPMMCCRVQYGPPIRRLRNDVECLRHLPQRAGGSRSTMAGGRICVIPAMIS